MNIFGFSLRISILLPVVFLSFFSLFPERVSAEEEIITKIEVRGDKRIEPAAILSNVKSRVGDYFSRETVSEDIKRIFRMGYFDDVQVERIFGNLGPQLIYVVKERPFVREIKIKGNKDVTKESIREVITARTSTLFSSDMAKETEKNIEELYSEKGFFLADISHYLEEDGDEAALVFEVVEGRKVKIKKINFLGNKKSKDEELLDIRGVETGVGGFFSWLSGSGKFEEETLQKDIDLMRAFYYNNGFIQVKIEEPQVFLSPDKKWLYITIRIFEGEQFSVGKIDFSRDMLPESDTPEEIKNSLKLKESEIFNSEKMRGDIVRLTNRFRNKGYAFANVSPNLDIDDEARLVNITYGAEKGSLVYIEKINITGNTKTRDKVIRREMRLSEGDLYNGRGLTRSRQRIYNLQYFEEVNLTEKRGSADDKIIINVEVKEGPTGTLTVGAGYSSEDGVVGMLSLSQGNLFGLGHKIKLSSEFGGESETYSLSYTVPYIFDTKMTAAFSIFDTTSEYNDYDVSSKGLGLSASHPIGEYSSLGVKYRYDSSTVSDVSPEAADLIVDQEGTTKTSRITTTISRNTIDNYLNPTKGTKSSLSLEYAGGILGMDNSFYKMVANSAWYHALPWDHVVMLRGKVGFAHSFAGDELSINEKFFLGGINTMRGFEYRSIGPEEIGSDGVSYAVGGDKMLLVNTEYLFDIAKEANLKGLFFIDIGNVYGTDEGYDLGNLRESAGFGFRWYSPIGPLRLEWGHVLDRQPGERSSKWEFSIGTFF